MNLGLLLSAATTIAITASIAWRIGYTHGHQAGVNAVVDFQDRFNRSGLK